MSEWQPIETAPKDGTPVLLGYFLEGGRVGYPVVALWHPAHNPDGAWLAGQEFLESKGYFSPTHWMPLPLPPS